MTRVALNGVELEVEATGGGPAVLALHGFTGTARTWAPLAAALRDQRHVIVPDLLGHGRSAAPADPARYALERQADDLSALLAALDAVPADVVGYSMGARLALVLALRHPSVVRGLILESPSAGICDANERAGRRTSDEVLAGQLERGGLASFLEAWEAQPLFASQSALPDDARARLRAERRSHDPRGLAASLRGAGQGAMSPLHDKLAAVGCPALIIAGALDPVGLERARFVAEGLPAAVLEIIDGAGHAPHLEQPDAFLRLAGEHLAMTGDPLPGSPVH
jgi:2-succinyl-6-hydroxy-2,4-cyclohexadiene-1-carboxylate synthase